VVAAQNQYMASALEEVKVRCGAVSVCVRVCVCYAWFWWVSVRGTRNTANASQARKDGNDGYDPYAGLPSDSDGDSSERDPYAIVEEVEEPKQDDGEAEGDSAVESESEEGEVDAPDLSNLNLS
jgi:hypothetical protein